MVGMPQQGVGIGAVVGVERDAGTGTDLDRGIAQGDRPIQGFADAGQGLFAFRWGGQLIEQDHELIPAQATDRVVLAYGGTQASGDFDQQFIARGMPPAVIDRFEIIEIQVADGEVLLMPLGIGNGLFQTIGEQLAVGQSGQGVVVSHVFQLGLVGLAFRDVGQQADVMPGFAIAVADRGDTRVLDVDRAVFPAVVQFAAPVASLQQGFPELRIEARIVRAGAQEAWGFANQFLACVPGQAGRALVGVDNGAAHIGNQDAFLGMEENPGSQALRLFAFTQTVVVARDLEETPSQYAGQSDAGEQQSGTVFVQDVLPGHFLVGVGAEAGFAEKIEDALVVLRQGPAMNVGLPGGRVFRVHGEQGDEDLFGQFLREVADAGQGPFRVKPRAVLEGIAAGLPRIDDAQGIGR